jgi:hypothetical protein
VLCRHRGEALRQQVIAAITALDLDEIALFAKMRNIFGQQQLHAAVFAFEDLIAFSGWHWSFVVQAARLHPFRVQMKVQASRLHYD